MALVLWQQSLFLVSNSNLKIMLSEIEMFNRIYFLHFKHYIWNKSGKFPTSLDADLITPRLVHILFSLTAQIVKIKALTYSWKGRKQRTVKEYSKSLWIIFQVFKVYVQQNDLLQHFNIFLSIFAFHGNHFPSWSRTVVRFASIILERIRDAGNQGSSQQ